MELDSTNKTRYKKKTDLPSESNMWYVISVNCALSQYPTDRKTKLLSC